MTAFKITATGKSRPPVVEELWGRFILAAPIVVPAPPLLAAVLATPSADCHLEEHPVGF